MSQAAVTFFSVFEHIVEGIVSGWFALLLDEKIDASVISIHWILTQETVSLA